MNTSHIFGIMGLTPGALGIWVLVAGLAAWWIRGMADRRRAKNEGVTADAGAYSVLFKQMRDEIDRLAAKIAKQDERIDVLERELKECEHARVLAETEVMRLKAINTVRGESNQRAQEIVAAEREARRGNV